VRAIGFLLLFLLLLSAPGFAGTWSGTLVDARCWGFEENNVGQKNTAPYVDRDRNLEVSLCSPSAKTKSFAVVPPDGIALGFDAAGNTKASQLAKTASRNMPIRVTVTGERNNRNTIQATSVTRLK
jgi:hypothetical protein